MKNKFVSLLAMSVAINLISCASVEQKQTPVSSETVVAPTPTNANPAVAVIAANVTGWYKQDSYLEKDPVSISIEMKDKTFVAYGYGLKKDKKTGKQIMDTWQVAEGDWSLNVNELTLKTKTGSCVYNYSDKTEVTVAPEVGRGFKFVSKTGKNTNFCRKLFIAEKSASK